ncbi:MAG: type II secretion system GspH family protein [Fusobacterium sp.]|nr:type II secretion system GspH family protein [Fusobacterium sp.]
MAEILLSLTIIGVVAAITLPSLTGNINERTWNTQRKALYARMSQAISLMPSLNGYGTVLEDEDGNLVEDNAAETFVTSALSKVLKINNICDSENLTDCGLSETIIPLNGGTKFNFPTKLSELNASLHVMSFGSKSYSHPDTKAAAFETQNGESVALYYTTECEFNMNEEDYFVYYPKVCLNFIYDLNGKKGPNTVGKDIGFMSVFYPVDSVLAAPMPRNKVTDVSSVKFGEISPYCRQEGDEYRLPNVYEAISLQINKKLLGFSINNIATGSAAVNNKLWQVSATSGAYAYNRTSAIANTWAICVKR